MAVPTLKPIELAAILEAASEAPIPLGRAFALRSVLERAVALASQPNPIGPLVDGAVPSTPNGDDSEDAPIDDTGGPSAPPRPTAKPH